MSSSTVSPPQAPRVRHQARDAVVRMAASAGLSVGFTLLLVLASGLAR